MSIRSNPVYENVEAFINQLGTDSFKSLSIRTGGENLQPEALNFHECILRRFCLEMEKNEGTYVIITRRCNNGTSKFRSIGTEHFEIFMEEGHRDSIFVYNYFNN